VAVWPGQVVRRVEPCALDRLVQFGLAGVGWGRRGLALLAGFPGSALLGQFRLSRLANGLFQFGRPFLAHSLGVGQGAWTIRLMGSEGRFSDQAAGPALLGMCSISSHEGW